jgi:hypothetical protein
MSDSSNVEVFILAAFREEIEKKENKTKRTWIQNTFVSRCNENEFRTLLPRLRKGAGFFFFAQDSV